MTLDDPRGEPFADGTFFTDGYGWLPFSEGYEPMPDNISYVSVATQTKVAALEQQIADLQATVSQLSAQLGNTSFVWGDAQAYRDASELPVGRLFVVVDTVANLGALAQEQDAQNATHAYTIFAGSGVG